MLSLLTCIIAAVIMGLLGILVVAIVEWALGYVGVTLPAAVLQIVRAIIGLYVLLRLLGCLFGGLGIACTT